MKKSLFLNLGTIAIIFSSLLSVSPANAASYPSDGNVSYTIGDSVSLDLGCRAPGVTSVTFDSGVLPDGLTIDGAGLVTGTPTKIGDFLLSGYHCTYGGGNGISTFYWLLTIHIDPLVTPDPILAVHNLNNSDCSFYLGYAFPQTPDTGSISFRVENQVGTVYIENAASLGGLQTNSLIEVPTPIENLNTWAQGPNFNGSLTGSEPFNCGDTISLSLTYQWRGAPAATKTVTGVTVTRPTVQGGSAPLIKAMSLNNSDCEFRIIGALPSAALPGSTKVILDVPGASTNHLVMTMQDSLPNGVIDVNLIPNSASTSINASIEMYPEIVAYDGTYDGIGCNNMIYVSLEYTDLQNNYWTSTTAVIPTKPASTGFDSDFTVSASRSATGNCSINVVATAPDIARPIAISIAKMDTREVVATMNFNSGITGDGVIRAVLSLANNADMSANIPIADTSIPGDETCSGYYRVLLVAPLGTVAESVFLLDLTTCNAGYVTNETNTGCLSVPAGYYTTELNSRTPIACPAGMTTATTASKSLNDCYMPIIQSIVGFKAPKALKFKGTVNLALTTNTKAIAWFRVTGPCSAKVANVTTTVKGKKVTTKMLKVTAGSKAGTCLVDLTAPTSGKYLDLSKVVQIKVSKTGK